MTFLSINVNCVNCGRRVATKSTIYHAKDDRDHVSTNNSKADQVGLPSCLARMKNTGHACFQPRCYRYICHLSRQITFVGRPIYEIHDGRVGQTDGHDLTPILSLNAKCSVVPDESRAVESSRNCFCGFVPIYVFLSQLYSPPLRSVSKFDKLVSRSIRKCKRIGNACNSPSSTFL